MLLFFSFLIISQILTAYSDLVEEKKYINDLKEDAKKEFIDRVVRRLAQEVDLKDVPTEESKKITDDELDKHSDFVKKIINEEKANFEKEVNTDVENKQVSSDPRRLSNETQIDFTLKEQKRKKRHENRDGDDNTVTTEVHEVTIPVQTIYDVDPNKGLESPVNESLPAGKDDIQVKGQRKSRRSAHKEKNVKSETYSTSDNSKNLDNSNSEIQKLLPSDKSKESNEVKSFVTEASEEKKPTVVKLKNNKDDFVTKGVTHEEDETTSIKLNEAKVETTTIDIGELSDQNKVLRDHKQDSKNSNEDFLKDSDSATTSKVKLSDVTSYRNDETTLATYTVTKGDFKNVNEKKALRDETLVEKTVQPDANQKEFELNTPITPTSGSELTETTTKKELKNKVVADVKRNRINDLTLTYNPYNAEPFGNFKASNLRNEKVKIVKVGPSSKTLLRSKLPIVKVTNIVDRRNPKRVNDEIRTLEIAEDVVKALRMGIDRDTKNKKLALRKKPNLKRKQVNIYGLRSFDEDKSLERVERNKEEPYYAPIYNYNPNNAYYNAYNKFGPNYDDSDENRGNEPQGKAKFVDLLNMSSEKLSRSFFKKPQRQKKKVLYHKPNKIVSIDRILPFIVKKPYKLPQNDYEEYLGDDYMREKHVFRSGNKIKEADDSLKNHLNHIRKTIHLRKETKANKQHEKDGDANRETGWIDDGVKYYLENLKNVAKPVKPPKNYQSINYDYIGEVRADKTKKQRGNLKSKYYEHVPTATPHPINSKEVITRIKKVKSRDSKEIVENFQKVFPLLKNLVQIVDDDIDEEVEACIKVMRDMINRNDDALEQYDWLESTVNIQSAIGKLLDLTRAAAEGLRMHPSDVELLKFTNYLFSIASEDLQDGAVYFPSVRARSPKSKTAKGHYVNHKQVLAESNQWLYRAPSPGNRSKYYEYESLRRFLNDLSDSLFDLHDALKHVSLVTNFKSQRWYRNLKDLYLHDPDRKKLLQVILHLGTTRLFNLIEDTSKNGVEEDFRRYVAENQTSVSQVLDAFVFVLKVLQASVYSR